MQQDDDPRANIKKGIFRAKFVWIMFGSLKLKEYAHSSSDVDVNHFKLKMKVSTLYSLFDPECGANTTWNVSDIYGLRWRLQPLLIKWTSMLTNDYRLEQPQALSWFYLGLYNLRGSIHLCPFHVSVHIVWIMRASISQSLYHSLCSFIILCKAMRCAVTCCQSAAVPEAAAEARPQGRGGWGCRAEETFC